MGKLVFVLIVKKFEGFDEEGGFSKKKAEGLQNLASKKHNLESRKW